MKKNYPGGRTQAQWKALSIGDRNLVVAKLKSELLGIWSDCANKRCLRARSCMGYSFTCYHHWRDKQPPAKRKRVDRGVSFWTDSSLESQLEVSGL